MRLATLAWVVTLLAPPVLASQENASVFAPQSPLVPESWHAALLARAALRDSAPSQTDVLRALSAELVLGRPERLAPLLSRYPVTDPTLVRELLTLEAAGAFASRSYVRAGDLFAGASAAAIGSAKGVLAARSGDAYERAGKSSLASTQYQVAREQLAAIADWLALREARVSVDTALAFSLLEHVPPPARRMVPEVKGEVFALAGDTARAVVLLAGAGFDGRAAMLALASRDTGNARQLAYRALRSTDTAVANAGIDLARNGIPPRTSEEYLTLGRALRRQSPLDAAALAGRAVTEGDSSTGALVLWGDFLSDAGDLSKALDAYSRAARRQDSEAVQAEFARARVLIRLHQGRAADVALGKFIAQHPTSPTIPMAYFLLADAGPQAGREAESDSLFRLIVDRWPGNEYASQARMRLATRSLSRGDTAGAERFYRAESTARGAQQFAARYLLGSLESQGRDSTTGRETWLALSRDDSLGYYGYLSRLRLGLPEPSVSPIVPHALPPILATAFEQMDLLDQAGFDTESSALAAWMVTEVDNDEDALTLAQALSARGRITQAIGLGWRAARTRTLNDARVLRAIYPWPFRGVVAAEATEFGLDPYLVAALIRQESSFDPDALSRAGARGLMQVMPGTARDAAGRMRLDWSDRLLRVPDANLHVGAAHFAHLLTHFRGDPVFALAAYNAGLLPVERWRRLVDARDPALFVERIPYAETKGYVRSVLRNWTIYRVLYPQISPLDSLPN